MRTYLHTRIPAYLHFCILHTCIPTYLHPYIPTYVHTYIPRSPLFASCCCIDWEPKRQTAFMLKKPQHSFLPFVFPAFLSSFNFVSDSHDWRAWLSEDSKHQTQIRQIDRMLNFSTKILSAGTIFGRLRCSTMHMASAVGCGHHLDL